MPIQLVHIRLIEGRCGVGSRRYAVRLEDPTQDITETVGVSTELEGRITLYDSEDLTLAVGRRPAALVTRAVADFDSGNGKVLPIVVG